MLDNDEKTTETDAMKKDLEDYYVVADIAARYGLSQRIIERRIEHQKIPAMKATREQIALLWNQERIKGMPPTGVWLIKKSTMNTISKDIMHPAVGRPHKQRNK